MPSQRNCAYTKKFKIKKLGYPILPVTPTFCSVLCSHRVQFVVEPAAVGCEGAGEDARCVLGVFVLVEFENCLPVGERADDLYLAARVAHRVAHTLTEAVLKSLRLVDDPDAVEQRHLKTVLNAGDGAALEDVVRRYSSAREPGEELAEHIR